MQLVPAHIVYLNLAKKHLADADVDEDKLYLHAYICSLHTWPDLEYYILYLVETHKNGRY